MVVKAVRWHRHILLENGTIALVCSNDRYCQTYGYHLYSVQWVVYARFCLTTMTLWYCRSLGADPCWCKREEGIY